MLRIIRLDVYYVRHIDGRNLYIAIDWIFHSFTVFHEYAPNTFTER